MINNIAKRKELEWTLSDAAAWVDMVERAMTCLKKDEKTILQRLYIYPEKGSLERLCNELGLEKASIYRRRDQALQTFTLALYGSTGEESSKG